MTFSSGHHVLRHCFAGLLGLLFVSGAAHNFALAQDDPGVVRVNWGHAASSQGGGESNWWDSLCNGLKSWRRHVRRSHQEAQRHLYYPKYEPHFSSTFGYYQTQWGAFPCDYGFASSNSVIAPPSAMPPAEPAPAILPEEMLPDEGVPMVPGADDPTDSYLPPPASPPLPGESESPAEPEIDQEKSAAPSLNLIPMNGTPEVEELFTPTASDELPRIRPFSRQQQHESVEQACYTPSHRGDVPPPLLDVPRPPEDIPQSPQAQDIPPTLQGIPRPPQSVLEQGEAPVIRILTQ